MIHFPWQHSPFDHHGLVTGEPTSLDGTPADSFRAADVAEIVVDQCYGNQFDGHAAFVVRLSDGRFAGWTQDYDSTAGAFLESLAVARDAEALVTHLRLRPPSETAGGPRRKK